jgi:GxxExxY protein
MIDVGRLKALMYDVVGALRAAHDELGPGLNEYCYQEGFSIELALRNIPFEREKSFHPVYKGQPMSVAYRLDFLCKGDIVVECKAVDELTTVMRAQLFNYMRLLRSPSGIIVNFSGKNLQLERYFYDAETNDILTVYGTPVRQ